MIGELLGVPAELGTLFVAIAIFGLVPGFALAGIVRLIPDRDRRRELQAELYEVPRWERPFWVAEQLEVAIRIGLFPRVAWHWGRHVWHRCKLESALELHRAYPESFWVPDDEVKDDLGPGDVVKLMWSIRRFPGERMWVRITGRDGDHLVGTLENIALFAYLEPGETIKFHVDDVIDYEFEFEVDEDDAA